MDYKPVHQDLVLLLLNWVFPHNTIAPYVSSLEIIKPYKMRAPIPARRYMPIISATVAGVEQTQVRGHPRPLGKTLIPLIPIPNVATRNKSPFPASHF